MTETSYQQAEDLQVISEPVHLACLEHREHGLANIESVAPVVIFHWSIVLLDTESPPADNLEQSKVRQDRTGQWSPGLPTYFVRNMEFIDQVEVKEHSQDTLESLAVIVLGVIEFITRNTTIFYIKTTFILRETCKD